MITYVIYSHSEFLDILKIQTDQLKSYENKVLLINKSDLDLSDIYSQYKQVIFYNDELPYASRLLNLSKLNVEYILFIHDIDIIVEKNDSIIELLVNIMTKKQNIDRVDLQYIPEHYNFTNAIKVESNEFEKFFLIKQENENHYIYNVNPSIWKLSSFLEMLTEFQSESYRTIELKPTQLFCKKYKVYKLYSDNYISCGWFGCLSFFQFIHITHYGELLPMANNNLSEELNSKYHLIIQNYLSDTNRKFHTKRIERVKKHGS
ncbi:MAG: hypothetical protein H8E98_05610 [Bacteroidetes bacterium]|nr:hypothetical protein [Bacteroidota bacterium]